MIEATAMTYFMHTVFHAKFETSLLKLSAFVTTLFLALEMQRRTSRNDKKFLFSFVLEFCVRRLHGTPLL